MQKGELFKDRYKIIGILGQGGMGSVYLAENIKLGTLWAIKEIGKHGKTRIDFLAEPNILKKLEHPALPRIFDILEDDENIYIVVDYIEGDSLDSKLKEAGSFPETTVLEWAKQLCGVLQYLHENTPNPIIYRDMKPANIIVTKSGALKLIDFGIAREYKAKAENDTVYIGTRGYAAPEQYGTGQTSAVTDIYSLGVTLYQLLTGKSPNEPPYEIKPVRYFNRELSADIERIIGKCTRQDPSGRYQSIAELWADIELICGSFAAPDTEKWSGTGGTKGKSAHARSFKKLVLTIWDNCEFGCELAYRAAKATDYRILLIDLDLLAPKADLCLNLKKYPGRFVNEGELLKSGFDITIEAAEKNFLSSELIADASLKRKDLKNLYVLTGNYKLENYEYYGDESLIKLIEQSYAGFDITILLVNRSIYDLFTMISMAKCDYNIAALRADLPEIREFNNYIAFLKEKQQISMDKTKFVAFEYNPPASLGLHVINEAVQGNLIGKIRYSRKRGIYRNLRSAYAARMEKDVASDYEQILGFFNILPKVGLWRRFTDRVGKLIPGGRNASCQNAS